MEIGQFANAARCLLVAKEETDYLLIHALFFEIVPVFGGVFLSNDTLILSKCRFGHFCI